MSHIPRPGWAPLRGASLLLVVLAGTLAAAPAGRAADSACGWPDAVQRKVLEQATRLMPAALRRQLRRHERALQAGSRRARAAGQAGNETHFQGPQDEDGTAARLAESLARITALLDGHAPLADVIREMGVSAHLVGDLSNPLRTDPTDAAARRYRAQFSSYLGEMLPDLRVVFEGYDDPRLAAGQVTEFGEVLAARSRTYLDDLVGAYRLYEQDPDPSRFDRRSLPFGVASLTFSRSVTDTARAWLHAWRNAHGDMTGLPFPLEDAKP